MNDFWSEVFTMARRVIDECERVVLAQENEVVSLSDYTSELEKENFNLSRELDKAHSVIKLMLDGEFSKSLDAKPAELSFLRQYEVVVYDGVPIQVELKKMDI